MFEKLKAKLSSHHSTHPLAKQRDEFLLVTAATPIEKKSHFTAAQVGNAAAYEAWKLFETHEMGSATGKASHARSKVVISELAENQVVKLVDERQIPFTSDKNRKTFIVDAQRHAVADALRTVRESGYYNTNELEAPSKHEVHGAQI